MELRGDGQPRGGHAPGFHTQEKEAVEDEQPRGNGRANKDRKQRRSEIIKPVNPPWLHLNLVFGQRDCV